MGRLEEFKERVYSYCWDSLPKEGEFQTNPNLEKKADFRGKLLPFEGNTIVYELSQEVKAYVENIQSLLYAECGEMLAEPLAPETFHITLHDLYNGEPSKETDRLVAQSREAALALCDKVRKSGKSLRLKAMAVFNMVNTSLVLGFEPADEESCCTMIELYEEFQAVRELSYPLTPHITIAYFKPGCCAPQRVQKLREVIEKVHQGEEIEVLLTSEMLSYQEFEDMNHYKCNR